MAPLTFNVRLPHVADLGYSPPVWDSTGCLLVLRIDVFSVFIIPHSLHKKDSMQQLQQQFVSSGRSNGRF